MRKANELSNAAVVVFDFDFDFDCFAFFFISVVHGGLIDQHHLRREERKRRQGARYSEENLAHYCNRYLLLRVVPSLILPLAIKFTT